MPESLTGLLSGAGTAPDRAAVVEQGHTTSYGALAARAGALSGALRSAGLQPGDRVAILLERSAEAVAALFASHAAGAIAVVLNDRLRPRQLEHILHDAEVAALLPTRSLLQRLGRPLTTTARIVDIGQVPGGPMLDAHPRPDDDIVQIIYTSGSTGLPKGVAYSQAAMLAGVHTCRGYLGLRPDDRIASLLAFSTIYGLNQLLGSLAAGATLVIEPSAFATDVVAALRREAVTVLAAVPPLWLQLLAVTDFAMPLPALRQMQNAGGHLPVDAVRRLRATQPGADLVLQYGMTETWRSTFLPPADVDGRPGSMGRAIPGAEVLVVREDGGVAAAGETGELVHAGPTIASGYWRAPEQTAAVFRPHPVRPAERAVYSGDLVRRDAEGFLFYVGRRDRIIKTLGFRVGPDEIADAAHASGEVAEVVVTGEDDPERGQRIVAWVVLAPQGDARRLARFLRAELPPHMQPSRIEARQQLPRLASGKYDVDALASPEGR